MDMETDWIIGYEVRQRRSAHDGGRSSDSPGDGVWFSLHFKLQRLTRSPIYVDEEGDNVFDSYDRHSLQTTVHRLLSSEILDGDSEVISLALLRIGVPIDRQQPIIDGIREKARSVCIDPTNAGHNLLHMEVSICLDIFIERRTTEYLEDQPLYTLPATEPSIEALERVTINFGAPANQCAICMEEIGQGTEANRIPCSHIYHKGCIRAWLDESRTCPLCRFPVPSMGTNAKSNQH